MQSLFLSSKSDVLLKMHRTCAFAWLYATAFFSLNTAQASFATSQATFAASQVSSPYLLGLGIGDITGPVVETNMMGYAYLPQTGSGLHMRQRSRAFIVADASNSTNRFVVINADIAFGDSGIRRSIVSELSRLFPGIYSDENVAIVGTHQHAGVGGYPENFLPQITSLGYVRETADAIVNGTVLAVQRAHESLAPGSLALGNVTVSGGNRNRSPSAYLANPTEERAQYEDDQDTALSLLKFADASGEARGFLAFFAVHGTSLYENNTLISSDNKGMAAHLYESSVEPDAMPGENKFVAGFVQSNVGDTSPNTLGAFCESPGKSWNGQPCDFNSSTCGGTAQDCHGRGPGFRISDFESNRIIGQLQVDGARSLMNGQLAPVTGAVRSVHTYLFMSFYWFTLPNGTTVHTCPAALGHSFAGGTTDGPGAFDFVQGDNRRQNPFWELVKDVIMPPPDENQVACHFPKSILLNTGNAQIPYEWSPGIVSIQMFRVGNLVILFVPGVMTTMAGRRIRNAVRARLTADGIIGQDAYVVIAGPANTYAHYVTTIEEYGVQRYEGASTLYGPYTLDAYIHRYSSLVSYLADNATAGVVPVPVSAPDPPNLASRAISLRTGVAFDSPGIGHNFGDKLVDVPAGSTFTAGQTVTVQFVGANPRNNLRLEGTFLSVEQLVSGNWRVVRSDSHPSTIYRWLRTNGLFGTSTVNISWTIEPGTPSGTYRLVYFGDSKSLTGSISPFSGTSSTFQVS